MATKKPNTVTPKKVTKPAPKAAPKKNAPLAKVATPAKKVGKKEEKEMTEIELVKIPSEQEIARIIKETAKQYALLVTLPVPPFVNIQLGLKLGELNPKELCSYWFDKAPRITAIPALSAVVPTVAYLIGIANALTPLANIPGVKISASDKATRDTYVIQLRNGINQNAASCVNLVNGNLPVFNLTTYRLKSAPVYFKGQLPAQSFVVETNVGPAKVRVKTKKNKYAKSYTIYHGVGEYNPATWKFQVGSCDQIVKGTAGVLENFIIVANTDKVEGEWPDPQGKRFPYN